MSESKKIAVLGCGGWGKNIVRTLNGLGELRAVVEPTEAGRSTARELAPDAEIHETPDKVLADLFRVR